MLNIVIKTHAVSYRFIFKPQKVTVEIISISDRDGGVTLLQVPPSCRHKTPNLTNSTRDK